MSYDFKPIINPTTTTQTLFTMDPFVLKSEPPDFSPIVSPSSSIPQLFSFLRSTFDDEPYDFVQRILIDRENSWNLELEKLRKNVELLEKSHTFYNSEILQKEEQLKDSLNKCEKLRENVAQLEEDKRVLCEQNLRIEERYKKINDDFFEKQKEETKLLFEKLEERYKKINDDFVEKQKEERKVLFERIEELKNGKSAAEESLRAYENIFSELNSRVSHLKEGMNASVIRKMELQDSGADMGNSSRKISEVNLKENNLGSSQGKDGLTDSPHVITSVCHSTGNNIGKSRNKAWDNGNPTGSSMACEAVSDKPGSSPVILIIDDDDEIANASKSSGLGGDSTCAQMKAVGANDTSNLMLKRKRSMSESESNDSSSIGRQKMVPIQELVNDGKMSFVGDNSNPEHSSKITSVTPCPEKSSEFIRPCEDKIGSIKESRKLLSEADLRSAFEIDSDLCVNAVCALYRRQISEKNSFNGVSCSGLSDEKSITNLGEYLTDGDHKLKRKAPEVKLFHGMCKGLAIRHCQLLFQLYHSKEDHLFCPGAVFSKL